MFWIQRKQGAAFVGGRRLEVGDDSERLTEFEVTRYESWNLSGWIDLQKAVLFLFPLVEVNWNVLVFETQMVQCKDNTVRAG